MRKGVLVCTNRVAWGELLESSLRAMHGLGPVRHCATGSDVLRSVRRGGADVVLLDPGNPAERLFDLARAIRRASARAAVVFIADAAPVGWVVRALQAGAAAFLGPCSTIADFARAIRAVRQGQRFFSPCSARIVSDLAGGQAPFPVFTERERTVLEGLCEGRSTKEIARALRLAPKTVESFRARLMEKTRTRRATGLVRYACAERFVDLRPADPAGARPLTDRPRSREN